MYIYNLQPGVLVRPAIYISLLNLKGHTQCGCWLLVYNVDSTCDIHQGNLHHQKYCRRLLVFFWYTTRSDASQCTGWLKTFSDGYLSSEDSDKTLGCELGCMGIYQYHKLPSPNWKGWYLPKESFDHQIHGDTGWWFSPGCAHTSKRSHQLWRQWGSERHLLLTNH